jgi:transcriptional regulator with XRE-family HTH domain
MYERIRNLREDRDLKQEDLAKLLSCTQACYSHYESGKRDIPTEVLIKLAGFYGVSVDYLLGLTKQRKPYP